MEANLKTEDLSYPGEDSYSVRKICIHNYWAGVSSTTSTNNVTEILLRQEMGIVISNLHGELHRGYY